MIETKADFTRALERLRRRDVVSLAAFILSLAQDSGPVGEQVRTFISGDDLAETVAMENCAAGRSSIRRTRRLQMVSGRAGEARLLPSLRNVREHTHWSIVGSPIIA